METVHYEAAGGIVVRGGDVLLLHKHTKGEIMLPKGHLEPGETAEAGALRETREETGYQALRVLADLGTLRAEFPIEGRWVVRDETYYLMELVDETRAESGAHDDAEHDRQVFERLWVPIEDAADRMSFEPARTFVRRAAEWVQANPSRLHT